MAVMRQFDLFNTKESILPVCDKLSHDQKEKTERGDCFFVEQCLGLETDCVQGEVTLYLT